MPANASCRLSLLALPDNSSYAVLIPSSFMLRRYKLSFK
jgi:hypothetical protein